jgi:hypothetical protein
MKNLPIILPIAFEVVVYGGIIWFVVKMTLDIRKALRRIAAALERAHPPDKTA